VMMSGISPSQMEPRTIKLFSSLKVKPLAAQHFFMFVLYTLRT